MATIEVRPGRQGPQHYRVKIRMRGTSRTATFRTLKEARAWSVMTEAALLAQRSAPTLQHTVGELLERYRAEVMQHKSPRTVVNQAAQLAWWTAQLGSLRLDQLTPARLAACRELLAQTRAPATTNRYLAVLSHACTVAIQEWGWMEGSPLRGVRRLREPRGRVRFLSDAERPRVLAACQASHNRLLAPVVVLALSTGARKMEILALRWPDVDLKRGVLTFHQTKNRERRTVPLTGQALALMQHHARVRRIDTPLVFPRADGLLPIDLRYAWRQALHAAGIADCRFHDLRHSAASYLAMQGASPMDIAEVLGHKTLAMVKRYAHLSEAHTRRVVERMNAAIFP
jgi:integrase